MNTDVTKNQDGNDNQKKENNKSINRDDKTTEAKVIPLQPSDEITLGDKITLSSENEDILTPVKDDKNDY